MSAGEGDLRGEVERVADALALLLAKRRTNGSVYMDGSHNPLPSEQRTAQQFVDDHLRAAVEQRTLAEQKVERVVPLLEMADEYVAEMRTIGLHPEATAVLGAFVSLVNGTRAALADPEADRGGTT